MKKKKRLLIGSFIIIFMLALTFTVFKSLSAKRKEDNIVKLVSSNKPEQNVVLENNIKLDDWNLLLVNKDNLIPEGYKVEVAQVENGYKVDKRILQDLLNLLKDARKEGLHPWICSSYRSSEKQSRLFNNKMNYYKKQGYSEQEAKQKASQWVAIPKTSEHEIGLSVDIVAKDYQILDKKQENTPEQKWLIENCHKYGFIMRYPTEKKEITKIEYEPWHYRYVGIENAKIMKENNFCLEEYIELLKHNLSES